MAIDNRRGSAGWDDSDHRRDVRVVFAADAAQRTEREDSLLENPAGESVKERCSNS